MIIKPDYNLKSIYDIDFDELKSRGIKIIIFDLDSTIMVSKSGCYAEKTKCLLNEIKAVFKIVVLSNNNNPVYMDKVRKISDFDVLGSAGKPGTKVLKSYLSSVGIKSSEAAIVGDRPLTDILCGKYAGCITILVDSINAENENILTRFVRRLERLVIKG